MENPWGAAVFAVLLLAFFCVRYRLDRAARPECLHGEVRDARRGGLWRLAAGRLLVLKSPQGAREVRYQFRKPGTVVVGSHSPAQARRLAALLREAATRAKSPEAA